MYIHSLAALTSHWDKTTLLCCSASTPILQKLPKCLQGFALSATQHSLILLITWLLWSKGPQSAYFLSFNWLTLITVPAVQVLKLKKGLLLLLLLPLESHLQSQKPLLHLFLGSFQFSPKWLRPILKTSLITWISLALHTNVLLTPHQDRLTPLVKTANYITPRLTWSLCDGLKSLKSSQMPLAALMPLTVISLSTQYEQEPLYFHISNISHWRGLITTHCTDAVPPAAYMSLHDRSLTLCVQVTLFAQYHFNAGQSFRNLGHFQQFRRRLIKPAAIHTQWRLQNLVKPALPL